MSAISASRGIRRALWVLGLSGVFLGAGSVLVGQGPGTTNAQVVATVNGHPIPMEEIKAIVEARPLAVTPSTDVMNEMREAALEMLIDDVLMRQFLDRATPAPNPAEMEKEISKLKEVLSNQKKSLEEFLVDSKQTMNGLKADITAKLRWRDYLTSNLTETEMRKYYDQNKVFFDKVFVRASHILLKLPAGASPSEREAARAKLEEIRQQVVQGKIGFEEAARRYSECPSKDKGGDIGPFPYKFVVVPEFAQTAFALRVGDISNIVTTNFGLHVIKVTDRTQGEPSSFENLKETVREVYAQDQELYQKILASQRQRADIKRYVKFGG